MNECRKDVSSGNSSYMDAVVLAATLPGEPVFIGKNEFSTQIFAGPFIRRLDVRFVERYDVAASLAAHRHSMKERVRSPHVDLSQLDRPRGDAIQMRQAGATGADFDQDQ